MTNIVESGAGYTVEILQEGKRYRGIVRHLNKEIGRTGSCATGYGVGRAASKIQCDHGWAIVLARPDAAQLFPLRFGSVTVQK